MYDLAADYIIHYRITARARGVKLRLWEPAKKSARRSQPYLYAANYLLKSFEEAKEFLRNYLVANGGNGAVSLDIASEGKLRILAYPTWNDFNAGVAHKQVSHSA